MRPSADKYRMWRHPVVRQGVGAVLLLLCLLPLFFFTSSWLQRQSNAAAVNPPPPTVLPRVGPAFAMAITIDQHGNTWVGSEDEGVWQRDGQSGKWRRFGSHDGLGDDTVYAVAEDRLGRIWCGHLNHGVSIYDGERWQTYESVAGLSRPDSLAGPIGQRVFAIKVCRTTGDVWIATDRGLTRYSERRDSWSYYTRKEGLVTESLQAIAFDKDGNIFCATQHAGLLCADANSDYGDWRHITGPDEPPVEAAGNGLPSNLLNDVIVSREGWIVAATDAGLAWSRDGGKQWRYARGREYATKVRDSYRGPPKGWKGQAIGLLNSDYVTCLAQDGSGRLQVAHRDSPVEAFDLRSDGNLLPAKEPLAFAPSANIISCVAVPNSADVAFGCYFSGVLMPSQSNGVRGADSIKPKPPLPGGAHPPTPQDLDALLTHLTRTSSIIPDNRKTESPLVVALPDDWSTRGDWLGRYGRYWACLCAVQGRDYLWGGSPYPVSFTAGIGPHHIPGDRIRHYVQSLYTDEVRTLEMPPVYLDSRIVKGITTRSNPRRQSEQDDHGEAYTLPYYDGPHLYYDLAVPNGLFTLAIYDVNKDGHNRKCPFRDFYVSIRPGKVGTDSHEDFHERPNLAAARINNFWEGKYTKFLLRGPANLTIEVNRNFSFDTIVAGIFLDAVDEEPTPYFNTSDQGPAENRTGSGQLRATAASGEVNDSMRLSAPTKASDVAERSLTVLEQMREINPSQWAAESSEDYVLLLRWMIQHCHDEPSALADKEFIGSVGTCYYWLDLYPKWEECQRSRGLRPARDIEKALTWNVAIPSYSGRGYQTIREYLDTPTTRATH